MRALVITNSITKRDSKSVEKYLNDISKYEVMTPEEELDAFKRFKNGEKHAFQKIIQCNLRFVVSVAKQYQHTGLSLNDLINEGNLGLIKAAERFDYTKGFKFISYAVWWIRQTILQAVNDKARTIRLPLNHQTNTMKLLRTRDELVQRLEREPSIDELAKETGMSHEEIVKSFQTHKFTRSLNAPVDSDGEATLETFLEDDSMMSPDHEVSEKESLRTEVAELRQLIEALQQRVDILES